MLMAPDSKNLRSRGTSRSRYSRSEKDFADSRCSKSESSSVRMTSPANLGNCFLCINNVTATEYLEMGQSGQRNQKGEIDIELSD
jgi:hypothetical protein